MIYTVGVNPQPFTSGGTTKKLEEHVLFLAADTLEGRGLGTEGKIYAKNYIAEQFRSFGLLPYDASSGSYFHNLNLRIGLARVPAANVVGYIKGNDPVLKDEYIVIGAHYDHLGYEFKSESSRMRNLLLGSDGRDSAENNNEKIIYRGADDNASGTASLIELARFFSENRSGLKHSVIFIAFDAEESGLLGSEIFVRENKVAKPEQMKLMFSLDMVGMLSTNGGLSLKGIAALEGGVRLAEEIAASAGIKIKETSPEIEQQTDTAPFGKRGIPAVHAFTGVESPYHKPEDTYEKLDYEGMAKVTDYLSSLIFALAKADELKPSKAFLAKEEGSLLQTEYGILAGLGTAHNEYPDEFFTAKSIIAFNAGLFLQLNIGKRFSVQPELLVASDGSKSPQGTFRRYTVTIPLNIRYYIINALGGMVKAFPFAGGYYRYSLAGSNGGAKLDFENAYNRAEGGINLGLGVEAMRITIAGTLQMGLTKIPKSGGPKIYSSGSYFIVGYRL